MSVAASLFIGLSEMILDEYSGDDVVCHARAEVEVRREMVDEFPLPCVHLPVGKQEIGDKSKRRRPERGWHCLRDPFHYCRDVLRFEQPLHPINQPPDGLA